MGYSNFALDEVADKFALKVREGQLVDNVGSIAPSSWLRETLAKFHAMALISEKSRSESIVYPILVACRELLNDEIYIYSGRVAGAECTHEAPEAPRCQS